MVCIEHVTIVDNSEAARNAILSEFQNFLQAVKLITFGNGQSSTIVKPSELLEYASVFCPAAQPL